MVKYILMSGDEVEIAAGVTVTLMGQPLIIPPDPEPDPDPIPEPDPDPIPEPDPDPIPDPDPDPDPDPIPDPIPDPSPGAIELRPGDDIQAALNAAPQGTEFRLVGDETHRVLNPLKVKEGQLLYAEPDSGNVLSGFRYATGFVKEGSLWKGSVPGLTFTKPHGQTDAGYHADHNEVLYVDGELHHQVLSKSDVTDGKWYADFASDSVYLPNDPHGALVEVTQTPHCFLGGGDHVTMANLVIEGFANPAQSGAIHMRQGVGGNTARTVGWHLENLIVRRNHGVGITFGDNATVRGGRLHHNGHMGITGFDTVSTLVEDIEIDYNNSLHFSEGWQGGGSKFALTRKLVVRRVFSHHNKGNGLWTDVSNIDTLYDECVVEDNTGQGIFHEISYDAVIRNCRTARNGSRRAIPGGSWLYGAGIQVGHSVNTEVVGCVSVDDHNGITALQQNRGSGPYGPHHLKNLNVHDCQVTMTKQEPFGHWPKSGMAQSGGTNDIYAPSANNRFHSNIWVIPSDLSHKAFSYKGNVTLAEFHAAGQS